MGPARARRRSISSTTARFRAPSRRRCWCSAGGAGEIVQVGAHVESNTPIYLVEFGEKLVVGCLEEEIVPVGGASCRERRSV